MIFIVGNDLVMEVVEELSDVQRECEGIDVENGEFLFFNSDGNELVPSFTTPNRSSGIWIFKWLESGEFILKPSKNNPRNILSVLDQVIEMIPNKYFSSLNDVRNCFLSKNG